MRTGNSEFHIDWNSFSSKSFRETFNEDVWQPGLPGKCRSLYVPAICVLITQRTGWESYVTVTLTCKTSHACLRVCLQGSSYARGRTDKARALVRANEGTSWNRLLDLHAPHTDARLQAGTLLPAGTTRAEQTYCFFVEFTRPPTGGGSSDPRSSARRRPPPFDCSLHPATVVV